MSETLTGYLCCSFGKSNRVLRCTKPQTIQFLLMISLFSIQTLLTLTTIIVVQQCLNVVRHRIIYLTLSDCTIRPIGK